MYTVYWLLFIVSTQSFITFARFHHHMVETKIAQPENVNTQQYILTNWPSRHLYNETFVRFKNLTALQISECTIYEVDSDTFRPISGLELLEISHNHVFPILTNEVFKHLFNLKVFKLIDNRVTTIQSHAFLNLNSLNVLTINKQNFSKVSKSLLEGLDNLTELSLSHNGIEEIDNDAFEDLKKLTAVYLSYNKLKSIHQNTFLDQQNVEELQLQNNNLGNVDWKNFDRMIDLKNLNLASNDITYLDIADLTLAFPNLDSLNFVPNRFTCPTEIQIRKQLKHYNITEEYYERQISACQSVNFEDVALQIFDEPVRNIRVHFSLK